MLRKEAKGSENDAEFCEKIFFDIFVCFSLFFIRTECKKSRIPGKKEEYYIFEITLGPFITLSFRNGHKLKD